MAEPVSALRRASRTAQPGRVCRCGRVNPFNLTGPVSRAVARHQSRHPVPPRKREKYNLDAEHIGIMGDSSGGWTAAMAAVTGDVPELEGSVGTTGQPSTVQAAVAFYPPTNFLAMDAWALRKCAQPGCHDDAASPESRLVGCAVQTCPDKVRAASPLSYITPADPPITILHGNSDPLVPHNQGEQLYMALNKACHEAVFLSFPKAGHGVWNEFFTDDTIRDSATIRLTSAAGCAVTNPTPFTPTWKTAISVPDKVMKK